MIKQTITYKDLEGNPVTEDFYFNLNEAELAELQFSREGGLATYFAEILAADKMGDVILVLKELLEKAIGERGSDGKQFVKNKVVQDKFFQSDAYNSFLMGLVRDGDAAAKVAEFFNGLMPAELLEAAAKAEAEDKETPPAWFTEGRVPTQQEIIFASPKYLQEAFKRQAAKVSADPQP